MRSLFVHTCEDSIDVSFVDATTKACSDVRVDSERTCKFQSLLGGELVPFKGRHDGRAHQQHLSVDRSSTGQHSFARDATDGCRSHRPLLSITFPHLAFFDLLLARFVVPTRIFSLDATRARQPRPLVRSLRSLSSPSSTHLQCFHVLLQLRFVHAQRSRHRDADPMDDTSVDTTRSTVDRVSQRSFRVRGQRHTEKRMGRNRGPRGQDRVRARPTKFKAPTNNAQSLLVCKSDAER